MEIIFSVVLIAGILFYVDSRIKKIAELTDRQMKVVVDDLMTALQEKKVFNEEEVSSFYAELNQKVKNVIK